MKSLQPNFEIIKTEIYPNILDRIDIRSVGGLIDNVIALGWQVAFMDCKQAIYNRL